ncbi:hypothetical protein H0H87_009668 [Tephrocybe sp. NHM501043]|nr:hypothetical protein H0H87_009668 [Tephrocybe sp. NHM501043]
MTDNVKIPLPKFLKVFTGNNVAVPKAMALSAKLYKQFNTPAHLAQLNDIKLVSAGIDSKDDRKAVLSALRKSGYLPTDARKKLEKTEEGPVAGPSRTSAVQAVTTPPKRKRKRLDDVNEFLPQGPADEAATYGSLDFGEILDEEILKSKATVVNRAPLMTLWAMTVAERLGFRREEALSIASAYTEMNAITKGVSLGIYDAGKERGIEAIKGGSQSYIEFIGRRPLYQTQTQQWRALSNGTPVKPSTAFSYISRAFRQTTPHITGALNLLANSFTVDEINGLAWGLYAEFRPPVDQWGARSEVKCSTILGLRKKDGDPTPRILSSVRGEGTVDTEDGRELNLGTSHCDARKVESIIKHEDGIAMELNDQPDRKKVKLLSLEEYEAALDQDFAYGDIDLYTEI